MRGNGVDQQDQDPQVKCLMIKKGEKRVGIDVADPDEVMWGCTDSTGEFFKQVRAGRKFAREDGGVGEYAQTRLEDAAAGSRVRIRLAALVN